MATERQIAANRLNAERSTGPKTPEGKDAVSRNAVTHGLTSSSGLLPGEKLEDFSDLRARVLAELAPDSAIEIELAERIASLLWRLRRVPAFEAALLAWTHACKEEASFLAVGEPPLAGWRDRDRKILVLERALDAFLKEGLGGKLSRYENALQRQLSALMLDLRRMQARRKAQGSPDICMGAAIGEGGGAVPGARSRRKTPQMAKPTPRARSGFWTEQKVCGYESLFPLWRVLRNATLCLRRPSKTRCYGSGLRLPKAILSYVIPRAVFADRLSGESVREQEI
jgi:hypothetical protein